MPDRERFAIVIAAAGSSRRYGADKLAETLLGRTVVETSVAAMRAALPDAPVIVVVADDVLESWRRTLGAAFSDIDLVAGGDRRQDSVRIGVDRADELGAEIVAIHDGARPLVNPEDVRATLKALDGADGAVLCSVPVDTVKRVDDTGAVIETLDRSVVRLAQTPQVFRVSALERAWLAQGPEPEWSDEAALLEAAGFEIRSVEAAHPNPKLTTPADLEMIRVLLERR